MARQGGGYVVGIDVGASHIHVALADARGELVSEANEKIRPENGPRPMIAQIKQATRSLAHQAGDGRLGAVGIGVPSPVDPVSRVATFANNLPGWKDIDLRRELEREFRLPVFLENDASMAAIGEHWRGVARGVKNFVFIALGTGIGSGIFAEGRLVRGRTGNAGELYRLSIEWPRWNEDFGDDGYFESHVSGLGIAAEGRKAFGADAPPATTRLAEDRDAYWVFEAYGRGEPRARQVLEKVFTMLGVGVANLVSILDPDLIVVGGGITRGAPEFLLATVEKVVQRIHPQPPPVKLSLLQGKAQIYGAVFSALRLARSSRTRGRPSRG